MSASLTHANGSASVLRARAQVPAWGRWWLDVDLADDSSLAAGDAVSVSLGGVTLVGAVVSGGEAYGRASYRIVAGSDGWSQDVEAKGYQDDSGVSIASVITDTASTVGEPISSPPSTRTGYHFTRKRGPAVDVLNALAPRAWYVELDGITRFGPRDDTTVDTDDPRTDRAVADTAITLETSDLSPYVPGAVVDGVGPAVDVEYLLNASRLSVTLYAGPRSSRELDAFRRILDALDPLRAYRCPYEYRVVTQDGDALNLQPVRVSAGLPDLARVPVRLAPGVRATHTLGSLVIVAFADGDPSRPFVVACDDPSAPGWAPTKLVIDGTAIELGDGALVGVARLGDTAGPYAITTASSKVKSL